MKIYAKRKQYDDEHPNESMVAIWISKDKTNVVKTNMDSMNWTVTYHVLFSRE